MNIINLRSQSVYNHFHGNIGMTSYIYEVFNMGNVQIA